MNKFVIPAQAGIQVFNRILKCKFKHWIPACAGMTAWLVIAFLVIVSAGAAETTIKGGRMELLNKGDTIIFLDGVRLDRGPDQMKSQRMETNRQRDKVTAEGDVELFRRLSATETWQAFGDNGFYNTQQGSGYLNGNKQKQAHVIHTEILSSTASRVVHVYADRIDFLRDTQKAFAKGRVSGNTIDPTTQERYDFWSDQADFDGEKKTIILYGVPQPLVIQNAIQGRRLMRGDKIVYHTELQHMVSEGKAQAVFEDNKEPRKK